MPDATSPTAVSTAPAEKIKKTPEQIKFENTKLVKATLIKQLDKSVILESYKLEHARVGQKAGVKAILAMDGKPQDIKAMYSVARMPNPNHFAKFVDCVALPIIGRIRVGHEMEAHIIEESNIDCIDESPLLGIVDEEENIDKSKFTTPFMCSAKDLPEALRQIETGASLIIIGAHETEIELADVANMIYGIGKDIRLLKKLSQDQLVQFADESRVSLDFIIKIRDLGKLSVPMFASGPINNPADAAFFMNLGCDGVVVAFDNIGGLNPTHRIKAMVRAVENHKDDALIADLMFDWTLKTRF